MPSACTDDLGSDVRWREMAITSLIKRKKNYGEMASCYPLKHRQRRKASPW